MRRRAAHLLSQIPATSSSAGAATTALCDLIATLAEPKKGPTPEVDDLTKAKSRWSKAVEQLTSDL